VGDVFFNGASVKPGDIPMYVSLHWYRTSTSVDFYFSRIRVIKMDRNNSETKQGAVVPADLLQQNLHVEVITHIFPPLAAGIS
jgi:hypothetical protein